MNKEKREKLERWFYVFKHGHPQLISEEADIICETRTDSTFKYMDDYQIRELIQFKVDLMYKSKFPTSKRWSMEHFKYIIEIF